jgi:hypothetical protein
VRWLGGLRFKDALTMEAVHCLQVKQEHTKNPNVESAAKGQERTPYTILSNWVDFNKIRTGVVSGLQRQHMARRSHVKIVTSH